MKETYCVVVESGSCDPSYTRWEERENCGHKHKTTEAAKSCMQKKWDGLESAHWFNATIHNQHEERLKSY